LIGSRRDSYFAALRSMHRCSERAEKSAQKYLGEMPCVARKLTKEKVSRGLR